MEKSMAALWWGMELGITLGIDPEPTGYMQNPWDRSITLGMDP